MKRVAQVIDKINEWLGNLVSWLSLFMVLMMTINVLMRYALSEGVPWQQEIVRFAHGILFLAGAAYALKHEALVRVDVLYQQMCEKRKAWVNVIGTIVFLFPTCAALAYFSNNYIMNSWAIYEGSAEYKGMPGVFVFKSFIWVAALTLAMQGVSLIVHSIAVIKGEEHVPEEDVHV
ncbi:MAG: TRAP transporter small permease subunit [Rickettsiales bacterium]|nr:TRAP transporter small permease subunit [Rickettsiales bacterium]